MESEDEANKKKEGQKKLTEKDPGLPMKKQQSAREGFQLPPSPPTFVTMRQLTEAANAFYNMSLAHEITVDSEFRIEKYDPPEDSLEHTVKETMHRAFWDMLRSSLEADPPDYQPTLNLLSEIKQSLNGLVLPNQKTLQKLVDSSLDLDAAKATLEHTGHLNLKDYAIQVINMMHQFCAPVRDQEVENLRKIDDPVEAFRNAFILLEKMHMDLANFTIAQMRPYIRQQAVQYERSKFATFLDAQKALGLDGLRRTREWIEAAFSKLTNVSRSELPSTASASSASASHLPGERAGKRWVSADSESSAEEFPLTPNNILREAYLELLVWPAGKDWPETVVMDQLRLTELGIQLANIVTLTSLVLVVCNFVASNASSIFPGSCLSRVDPSMMVQLKQMVCKSGIGILRNSTSTSTQQRGTAMAEEIIFTVERWLNTTLSSLKSTPTTPTDTDETPGETDASKAIHLLPDPLKETLSSQVVEVVSERHPVFILMNKRAIGFLRSALSAYPPEPLPLPPGFSILSDVTRHAGNAVTANQTDCSSSPSGHCPPSQPIPSAMATGLRPRTPDADPPKRLQKLEHLSLSNLASRLLPLLAHNRHVFGPQYAEIIQALLLPNTEPSPSTVTRLRFRSRSGSAKKSESEEETFEMT
ncbi:T-complex protein 11-like protein 1 [Clonorchis sinensis]|uniref:T-complex protein 11-like protein 1 n=1 Tax=Clonorchis sinensis TaxID=79923 RepID=A0A8T1MLP7_CLOSI|nr:T-complex protein 11-like protein 1 [Clonorchis sinensis]